MLRTILARSTPRALPASIRYTKPFQIRLASTATSKEVDVNGRRISIPTGLFINNKFVPAIGGNTFGVENPTNGKEILQIQEGREEDVEVAVKAARACFESDEWANSNPAYRGELLNKLADLMQKNFDELVAIEMLDTGKTHAQASALDVPGSIGTLRYYGGWADKILGLTSFNIPGTFAYTRREPVGVCGQIIPWK